MSEQNFFQSALSNFVFEAANGGVIRHFVDLGYTVKQIAENLSFSTPYEKIQKAVWEHLLNREILLLCEPGNKKNQETVSYVQEKDKYGRTSFRKISLCANTHPIFWKEKNFDDLHKKNFRDYLAEKCSENREKHNYISCDFGIRYQENPSHFLEDISPLDKRQQDYILGLPWPNQLVYHILDSRMREIILRLFEKRNYHGTCYFIDTSEKILF